MLCSNYRAEVLALLNGTETINSWEEKPKKSVFLTDSLSVLKALMSDEPGATQKKLTENISTLAQSTCIVLQWISAHTGIRGNEIIDKLSKEGRETSNPHLICPIEKSRLLSMIKRKPSSTARLEVTTQTGTHSIRCHNTNRPLCTIFRLRTGLCRLNSHLKRTGSMPL